MRILAVTLALLLGLAVPAQAKDILVVVLKLKDGTLGPYQQVMPPEQCDKAMDEYRKVRDAGNNFVLTLEEAGVTGTVQQMYCVRRDATIWGPDGMVHPPDPSR